MQKLTIKQENFCQKYLEYGNASQAYRFAYNCEKMKPESVNRLAVELLSNIKVTSRVQEIQKLIAEKAIATKEDKLHRLEAIFNDPSSRPSEVVAAIKVHNEMIGHNAPAKTEITGKDGAPLMPEPIFVEIIDSRDKADAKDTNN